jgi:hypothetical protein
MNANASEREYIGDALPKWIRDGVLVRTKSTPITRRHGLQVILGRDRTWPGEVGTIRRRDGNGWWDWQLCMPRGLSYTLDLRILENLIRVPKGNGI